MDHPTTKTPTTRLTISTNKLIRGCTVTNFHRRLGVRLAQKNERFRGLMDAF